MESKRKSLLARLLAVVGLLAAIVVSIVAISGSLGDDGESKNDKQARNLPVKPKKPRTKAKSYEVKSGDTLESISSKTGIPVQKLERLNPGLDPQVLQLGQEIKLR